MKLYELVLKDGYAVSPFVWRVKMELAHKCIEPETVPIGYGDKDQLAFSGQDRVPVIVDGGTVVSDSWRIACYLDDAYPNSPPLFGSDIARGMGRFVNIWCDSQQLQKQFMFCAVGTFERTPKADKPYFRQSRLEWTGMTIEQMAEKCDDRRLELFRETLSPVRQVLKEQAWLAGDTPAFPDYCLFGGFMWARTTIETKLLEADDPIEDWRQRMLDLFGGLAREAPAMERD